MQDYNNGHVVDTNKIPITDYEIAAKEWSEGSKALEELLLFCLKNNIVTQACCAGHKDTDTSYLQFELSERNLNNIIKIINAFYNLNGVHMSFYKLPAELLSHFTIRVPQSMGEHLFEDMLTQLSNEQSIDINSLSSEMQDTINAMMNHKIPNDLLEIQYSNEDNQKKMFVATTNPAYSDLYWHNKNAKPWLDHSISIEGTPEEINPTIKHIIKEAPIQYDNYIESERRKAKKETIKEQKVSLNTSVVPDKPTTFVANAQATRKNDYARQHGITIVEILPGMSIDEVASEICGKRYMGKFNNFQIDGTKYTSPEEIAEAYYKHLETRNTKVETENLENNTISIKSAVKNALKDGITPMDISNVENQQSKDERSGEEHEQ